MNNFWQKKSKTQNFFQKLSSLVLAILIFNLASPSFVFASDLLNEENLSEITHSENSENTENNDNTIVSDEEITGQTSGDTNDDKTTNDEGGLDDPAKNQTDINSEVDTDENKTPTTSNQDITEAETELETEGVNGESGTSSSFGIINTGNATTFNSLTNLINNLSINSSVLTSANNVYADQSNIDLRPAFFQVFNNYNYANSTDSCERHQCRDNIDDQIDRLANEIELSISFLSNAFVQNQLALTADTGHNTLSGDGFIVCGEATVFADVVNIVNNIAIDSNVLFQSIYKQGNLDFLVLPNSNFFEEKLLTYFYFSELLFNNNSSIVLENNLDVAATTGDNTVRQGGEIESGDALAKIFIRNLLNRTLVNSLSFNIEIQAPNLQSSAVGILGNLPENMSLSDTLSGVKLSYEPSDDFYFGNTFSSEQIEKLTANINPSTTINNFLKLYANSGYNEIAGNGVISCGNATAVGNIVNYANNIVIGSQLVDILIRANNLEYLAFGQPDLQIGLGAVFSEDDFIKNGSEITYLYTVFNGGDRLAENVIIKNSFPLNSLESLNPDFTSNPTFSTDGETWVVGDIAPGEVKEFKATAKINPKFAPYAKKPLPLTTEIYQSNLPEDDFNLADNKDSLTLNVGEKNIRPSIVKTPANLILTKIADKNVAKSGDIVTYTVEIDNRGEDIFNAVLIDTMVDQSGKVLSEQTWPLETIMAGEIITINYSITIPENITSDVYTNYAEITGFRSDNQLLSVIPFSSDRISFSLIVEGLDPEEPEGEVLGTTTALTCGAYLTSYLKINDKNDPEEVMRLQFFLKNFVDSDIEITSVFDKETEQAVRKFQEDNASEILTPWQMNRSSGYVYYTTQKKINEIMCGNTTEFPLSLEQLNEIDNFKRNKDITPEHELIFASNNLIKNSTLADNSNFEPKLVKKITFSDSDLKTENKPSFFYRPLGILLSLLKIDTKTTFKF